MTDRAAIRAGRPVRRLPWVLCGAAVAVSTASAAASAGRDLPTDVVVYTLLPVATAALGALVASRHPRNPIGWVLVVLGVHVAVQEAAQGYSLLARDVGLPGGAYAAWFTSWSWVAEATSFTLVFLLFPDGRLLGDRWRPVAWLAGAAALVTATGAGLWAGEQERYLGGSNPFGVGGPVPVVLLAVGSALVVAVLGASVVSLALRFARSTGVERTRLTWVVLAAALMVPAAAASALLWSRYPLAATAPGLAEGLLVAATATGILRHRLFDIDLALNRTLVYGTLTVLLGAAYVLTVLLLRVLAAPFTAENDLAVAGSTLAVAALFRPLRARVQAGVDRRFYRRRYDAQHTLDAFGTRLRHELDLDSVGRDLRAAVTETVQPAHVRLWLRPEP